MRWKVLILTSLAAAIAGAGVALVITLIFYNSLSELLTHGLAAMATLILLLLAVAFAGFFVYRHTPRRRKLQTLLAVLLTLILIATGFALGSILTPRLYLSHVPSARIS